MPSTFKPFVGDADVEAEVGLYVVVQIVRDGRRFRIASRDRKRVRKTFGRAAIRHPSRR